MPNVTGYGLFDQEVLETIRWMDDPDPYIRGLVTQLGYKYCTVEYTQSARTEGKSSYNFFRYFDFAMTGVTHVSQKPLRLVTFAGMFFAIISFIVAVIYLFWKLLNWNVFLGIDSTRCCGCDRRVCGSYSYKSDKTPNGC